MSHNLSIGGDGDDWIMFGKTAQSGNQLLFRSRTRTPEVHAFAEAHFMARLRCVLAENEVADGGMPKSTRDLDDYEDRLIGQLKEANAEVYLIAVVTGDGNRDLFFAARDLDDLRAGIKAAQTDIATFKLQIAPVGDKPAFLKMLTLSPEAEQAAIDAGRVHGVHSPSGGGLLGKLLGH
jgi:hypothetical protein